MKVDVIYNKSSQRMEELSNGSIDMCMTSPPYWGLRDYGEDVKEYWPAQPKLGNWHGQLGLEPTFQLYLDHMMIVCAEIKRVLKKTASLWLNLGDTYWGGGRGSDKKYGEGRDYCPPAFATGKSYQPKCLLGIPWRLVLCLVDEQSWILRNAIIWHKPNAMPSSVKDRCSNSYEHLFHLVKAKKYYYDLDAIREKHIYLEVEKRRKDFADKVHYGGQQVEKRGKNRYGRSRVEDFHSGGKNPGDVWLINTQPRPEAHFATFPDKLCIKPIVATCPLEICRKCGKARVRIVKPNDKYAKELGQSWHNHKQDIEIGQRKGSTTGKRFTADYQTIGWTDCGCNAGWDSGVLLDPFAGRGTALIMAKKLGRHYIGYELKKEYADMAEGELENIDPLFRRR